MRMDNEFSQPTLAECAAALSRYRADDDIMRMRYAIRQTCKDIEENLRHVVFAKEHGFIKKFGSPPFIKEVDHKGSEGENGRVTSSDLEKAFWDPIHYYAAQIEDALNYGVDSFEEQNNLQDLVISLVAAIQNGTQNLRVLLSNVEARLEKSTDQRDVRDMGCIKHEFYNSGRLVYNDPEEVFIALNSGFIPTLIDAASHEIGSEAALNGFSDYGQAIQDKKAQWQSIAKEELWERHSLAPDVTMIAPLPMFDWLRISAEAEADRSRSGIYGGGRLMPPPDL